MNRFDRKSMLLGVCAISLFFVSFFALISPAHVEAAAPSQTQLASLAQILNSLQTLLESIKGKMMLAQVSSSTSCPSGYYYMGDSGGYCKSDTTCQPLGGGATYTCPTNTTYSSPSGTPYSSSSPYPSSTTYASSCPSSLTALLGDGCHYMHNDASANPIYCDGPMTKSAKLGDTTTITGCSSGSSSASPSYSPSVYPSSSPYPSSSFSGCDSSLTALLGTGCHYMYSNSLGASIYCDGPMTKSAKSGDTTTTTGCTSSGTGTSPSSTTYSSGSAALAASVSGSDVTLRWNDFYQWEDEYQIERRISGGSWIKIGTVVSFTGGTGMYQDTGISSGTYEYHVRPCLKTSGCVGESNVITITVGGSSTSMVAPKTAVPAPVIGNISATGITLNSATINWNTDVTANSKVEYWVGTTTHDFYSNLLLVNNHSVPLTGLQASSTYTYNVISESQDYYRTTFSNQKFTTLIPSVSQPSPAPTISSCPSSVTVLLGDGCHYMHNDASANPIYCDGPMTKSAKLGDTVITQGCGSSATGFSALCQSYASESSCRAATNTSAACVWYPNHYDGSHCDDGAHGGGNYSYATTTVSNFSSCPSSLTALLGDGCHYMYNDASANPIYCDGPMTKSAKSGDTTATTGCSSSGSTFVNNTNSCPSFSYSRWDRKGQRYCQLNSGSFCQYTYPDYLDSAKYSAASCPVTGDTGVVTYPFRFSGSGKSCNTYQECYDYCKTTPGSGTGDPAICDQYFPGATSVKIVVASFLTSVVPISGSIGTRVTIYGSGFSAKGNRIDFDTGVIMDVPSMDGKTITFSIPADRVPLCALSDPRCLLVAPYNPVKPGTYWISVTNANGVSNTVSFGVTESVASTFSVDPVGTYPKPDATNVPVGTRINIKFTREFDPESTYKEFFRFAKTAVPDSRISGSFSMHTDGFEFLPAGELEPNTSYTYTVLTMLRDRSGVSLSASYIGSFVTSASTRTSGAVVGRVTDADGTPINKAYVRIFSSSADPYSTGSSVYQNYFSRNTETDTTGAYQLSLPPGTYFVEAYPPSGRSDVTRAAPKEVVMKGGEIITADITFGSTKKIITGAVLFSDGSPVTDAEIGAYASETRQWTNGTVDANGRYALKVSGGKWFIGIYPRAANDTAWSWNEKPTLAVFTLDQTAETKTINFTVPLYDATLMVSAVDELGVPVSNLGIVADMHSASSADTLFSSPEFRLTGSDGKAVFFLRAQTYYVRAYISPSRDYLNPDEQQITLVGGDKKELKLVLRKKQQASLLVINGVTKIEEGIPVDAFVWAWSERGGFVSVRADAQGAFSFTVTPNERWHVGAGKEYKDFPYKSPELLIEVKNSPVTIDLLLTKQTLIPLPPTINVTQAAAAQVVAQVSDGAQITIPPSGAAASGNVQVEINPTVEAPSQAGIDIVSTVYDVKIHDADGKEVTTLAKEMEIVIPYSEEELKHQGVSEDGIVPSYFNEKSSTWVNLDKCTIDKVRNAAICHVDHLTRFAMTARADNTPPDAPATVKITAVGGGRINLAWKNPAKDFDYAKIYRSSKAGELGIIRAASVRGIEFIDQEGLANGVTYYYTVRAVDIAGNESVNTAQQSVIVTGTSVSSAATVKTETAKKAILQTLRQGMKGDEVRVLQQLLINEGLITNDSVTGFFGALTKAAVIRFQEKYAKDILAPVGLIKGSGVVGPGTRLKINALLGQ